MRLITLVLVLLLLTVTYCNEEDVSSEVEEAATEDPAGTEDSEQPATGQPQETTETEDQKDETDPTEQTEAEGVSSVCIFPDEPERKFPAGKTVEALIGFQNQAENAFHVEYIRGALYSPQDGNFLIQNFTGLLYNTTVASAEEACLLYRFKADPALDPRQYALALQVFYTNDDNETYLSTVFNNTVDILDPESTLDAKSVFAYLCILGIFAGAGYFGWKVILKGGRGSKKRRNQAPTAVESGTSNDGVDWDYISSEHKAYVAKRREVSPDSPVGRRRSR
eukprot:TRINITY_DN4176_c0_g1_i2.p1 TRINITY_DN4176_c0_g1~~TRINITY_DN4176_c0_g1_i2.p1  ORF type:complete len:280 (+),score=62.54 TRINITY_DN4176_c0_g1_i2:55-894(+)